jgi:anaerobic magnesium-protoporphyrin IX monomethyl ester cyclase
MNNGRVLLINPTITSRRSARFPLSLLSLAAALAPRWSCRIVDGNVDRDYLATIRRCLAEERFVAVGISVMGGPQVRPAIEASMTVRAEQESTPIIWGGYFPTLYTSAALNAPYVDYAVRGPGEKAFAELLDALTSGDRGRLDAIAGIAFRREGSLVRTAERRIADGRNDELLPYELLGDPRAYLAPTFLGRRTAAHQAAIGCRFRCTFCGVAGMFRGAMALPPAQRLERDLIYLKQELGADSIQYFDHNFFDREVDMMPLLEVMARVQLPWWCYARADALLNLSAEAWTLVRRSRLRMAYIGAESPNDAMLKSIRKGTRSDQTLAVAELCRQHGVVPELSFMVAPPVDTESATEQTFEFIREVKRINPRSEIIVYIYTPLPLAGATLANANGEELQFPRSPEEWTQPRWVDYACHADAPWVSERLRRRIDNFVTVLGCRFPTAQDIRLSPWARTTLSALAYWRYGARRYDRPWELSLLQKLLRPARPQLTGI